ncbi:MULTISPECIES: YrdB family protein [Bacillus]|nr:MULTISPECIES: YrdB family protein [Bacillus cereus group]MCU5385037.1 YrdB family protein [Bacillus cereus]MDA1574742.1 YrdB family protein [Bacillus cereus group sp. TH242-3LC]MDA2292120.1 YrdB family protein [Bacillus cereus group sp. Bc191]MDA2630965.1 YrdB family protein [Bacillus cereus]WAI17435.1 YrdB family protein [Bacillus cereus]
MAAFSYWGYHIKTGAAVKIILAVATPLVIATLWGIFLSPKASLPQLCTQVGKARSQLLFRRCPFLSWQRSSS